MREEIRAEGKERRRLERRLVEIREREESRERKMKAFERKLEKLERGEKRCESCRWAEGPGKVRIKPESRE